MGRSSGAATGGVHRGHLFRRAGEGGGHAIDGDGQIVQQAVQPLVQSPTQSPQSAKIRERSMPLTVASPLRSPVQPPPVGLSTIC